MRKALTILAFLATVPATRALAGDDCLVPMADWQPRAAVAELAARQGWTVRRIRIDDGCYEIDGRDAAGRAIEVKLDPGTLAIVRHEFEEEGEHDHGGKEQDED